MSTEFALDLRLARRKAGYNQCDVAHLLTVGQSHISSLERGRIMPSVKDIVALSLLYGRSFESLFKQVMQDAQTNLRLRLQTLPKQVRDCPATRNRDHSLASLKLRLHDEEDDHGGA